MKKIIFILLAGFSLTLFQSCETETLSDEEIAEGLREALRVGTQNSVINAHQTDGYYGDLRIRIPWPEDAELIESTLRGIGLNGLCDSLILKLNRAGEDAADEAEPIFLNAVTAITIEDAFNILHGADDAATQYLKANTYDSLHAAFKPDIENSLSLVGAQQAWATVVNTYNSIPLVPPANSDLAQVTTTAALNGLFILIADEELKIRTDINARINEILKKVFGELDN